MRKTTKILSAIILISTALQTTPSFSETVISMNNIYNYASQGNLKKLKSLKDKLNTLDSNGNSAVCQTVINNDFKGYNTLKKAGANMKPECLKKIPADTYTDFMNTLNAKGISGGDVATASTATTAKGTFLGMGTLGWGITGAVVVGGVAAAAGGGGGGGGGSSAAPDACAGITCGTNAHCSGGVCSCNTGYEGDANTECTLIMLNCNNGVQIETKCQCDSGWTGNDCTQPVSCPYSTIECDTGYEETGLTCRSGNSIYKQCKPVNCESQGYKANCEKGYDATQSCISGNTPYYTCTPTNCSAYSSSCGEGYDKTVKCNSAGSDYYECTPKSCTNFTVGTCPINAICNTCKSGETDTYQISSCQTGWKGPECNQAETCPNNYTSGTSCEEGYSFGTKTCQSGNTQYKECVKTDCSNYSLSCANGYIATKACQSGDTDYFSCSPVECGEGYSVGTTCSQGYHQEGNLCLSGTTNYIKCVPDTCPATHTTKASTCSQGYTQVGDICYSGKDTYLQCVENEVPPQYQDTPCDTTRYVTSNTILSGSKPYYLCSPITCGDGYNTEGTACQSGYSQIGEICYSGETSYVKCEMNECAGYTLGENCPDHSVCSYCQRGAQKTYKITDCEAGYGISGGACVRQKGEDIVLSTNESGVSSVVVSNDEYVDIYGLKLDPINIVSLKNRYNNGNINITNEEDGDVYGTYNVEGNTGPYSENLINTTGTIEINNTGNGNVSGMRFGNNNAQAVRPSVSSSQNTTTGIILISNEGNGNVYGINDTSNYFMVQHNAYATGSDYHYDNAIANGTITITNEGNGDVYGIYGRSYLHNASTDKYGNMATGHINITNEGNGKIYGLNGNVVRNASADSTTTPGIAIGDITIKNNGSGTIFGISGYGAYNVYEFAPTTNAITQASINIDSIGDIQNIYGIYASDTAFNMYTGKYQGVYKAEVNINNIGAGNLYGIYATHAHNNHIYSGQNGTRPDSYINLANSGNGLMVGISGSSEATNDAGTITLNNAGNGKAYGIAGRTAMSSLSNKDKIVIKREDFSANGSNYTLSSAIGGTAVGIYAEKNSTINNAGTISISGAENGFGIYAKGNGGKITNSGTIDVSATNAYGIYVENGTNTTVTNTGTIKLNGITCTGNCSGAVTNGNYIVLNGATLVNNGLMSFQSLNTNLLDGDLTAGKDAQFNITNNFTGPLNLSTELVSDGFNTTYVNEGMINAGDTSGLNLVSKSALFDAKLADNGSDVIMKMKSFDSVIENNSLAQFLANNYALGNNEQFFSKLKAFDNLNTLTNSLDKMMGKDMLSRFNFEDMTMMRELNFDMNEHLFHNKEQQFSLAGTLSPMAFKGDTGSNSRYSLTSKRDGAWSVGLGIAFTDIHSDDDNNNNNRSDTMYQMIVPIGYRTHGFNLITSPRMGYARGNYDRTGFDNSSYDGTIEKRIFGLMNEARYPVKFGEWSLEPSVEFNMLGYSQKGHEDDKDFSLDIKKQNTYSVESGIGFYLTKDKDLSKNSRLKMTAGFSAYHEFADPYKLELGMNGMDGSFTLRDENRSDNRAVARFGFDYDKDDVSFYGNFTSFIDREFRSSAKTGFKWKF